MTDALQIEYEVIGRAVVTDKGATARTYLNLLYRGDGTPWWCASPSMQLLIPEDFAAAPGDRILIAVTIK